MSEEKTMAKVFYEETVNGETVLRNYTTTAQALPFALPVRPGAGKKFWTWPAVSNVPGVIACDFTDAPVVGTPTQNVASIAAITATPEDVLIWQPVE